MRESSSLGMALWCASRCIWRGSTKRSAWSVPLHGVRAALTAEETVGEGPWEDAYLAVFPQVYRGLIALGARPDEAEDALHDAFVRGLEGSDVSSPAGWLFVVAARRWRRRRWRDRVFRRLAVATTTDSFEPAARIDLFDALRKLPQR